MVIVPAAPMPDDWLLTALFPDPPNRIVAFPDGPTAGVAVPSPKKTCPYALPSAAPRLSVPVRGSPFFTVRLLLPDDVRSMSADAVTVSSVPLFTTSSDPPAAEYVPDLIVPPLSTQFPVPAVSGRLP